MTRLPSQTGFVSELDAPTRRAIFDMQRRVAQMERTPPGSGGGGFTFIGPTEPTGTEDGQTWYNTATGEAFVWYGGDWVEYAPGSGGSTTTVSYVHTQGSVSSTWTITHNLGWYPNVTVVDSGGSVIEGEIIYVNVNTIQLLFSGAFSGVAYLS